jgi:ribosome-binding protein aMBF1 (putative translation factor)
VLYARMAKGWSQSELARRVETKQANISRIEASLANPTFDLIRRLCDVLEIEVTFSGPSILDGTLAYKQSETTSGTVVEEYYRVDDQVGNVFCGSFDTKTGKTSESEVLN